MKNENSNQPNPMPILSINLGDTAIMKLSEDIQLRVTVTGITRGLSCGGIGITFIGKLNESITGNEPKFSGDEGNESVGVIHTCLAGGRQTIILKSLATTLRTTENAKEVSSDKVWVDWQEFVDDCPSFFGERQRRQYEPEALFDMLFRGNQ